MKNNIQSIAIVVIALVVVNLVASKWFSRADLTSDKRFTLAKVSKEIVTDIDNSVFVTVYLEGDLPSEYTRLQLETKQFLEELTAINSKIRFQFVNPENKKEELVKLGVFPVKSIEQEDSKVTETFVFPWAEIRCNSKVKYIPLVPNNMFKSREEQLENAIANLEFSFVEALYNMSQEKIKKIAVLSGNGELSNKELSSLYSGLKNKYSVSRFDLGTVATQPQKTLSSLNGYDLAIIAKPTKRFSDEEKLTLDQYINNGGRTMWMLDTNNAEMDSLARKSPPEMMVFPVDLNLTDLLFNYGVRVNTKLIKDLNSAKFRLATGGIGGQVQYKDYNWFYHPLARVNPYHSITKNVMPVRLRFATQIDTLDNKAITKTPLLVSSLLTKQIGTPNIVRLNSISKEPQQDEYKSGYQLFGVLLEGEFNSAYKSRTLSYKVSDFKSGVKNKMVVISDGDICRNQFIKGQPIDLNIDKWTRERFGNNDFILNTVDYLLDDIGLIQLRNKSVKLKSMDKKKLVESKSFWKAFNIILPLILLAVFGFVFNLYRKKKYRS